MPVTGNHFYRETPGDWLVLRIDPAKLSAAVKLERAAQVGDKEAHTADEDKLFPHLYGPLNLDAVVEEAAMDRTSSGKFLGILVCVLRLPGALPASDFPAGALRPQWGVAVIHSRSDWLKLQS